MLAQAFEPKYSGFRMNVLAVDTCLQPGSVALLRTHDSPSAAPQEGWKLEVIPLPPGWRSVALHAEIARLLACHSLSVAGIDLYAVTAGPGAFTGVRLGLTAVKGLAEVHNKPVVPVSTLEALAAKGSDQWQVTSDTNELSRPESLVNFRAPILDARRGQVFAAVYRAETAEESAEAERTQLRLVIPETVCSLRAFLDQVEAAGLKDVQFCLADESVLLELQGMQEAGWRSGSLVRVSPHLAGTVAQIAFARFRRGQGITALAADSNYIRASDAELFWKE